MSQLEDTLLFHIRAAGLPEPVREWRFHKTRKWRFDLAYPALCLAIEIEGGTWANGRHNRPTGFENDCLKYSEAAIAGWRVIRVTGDMVRDGRALRLVERALAASA